MSRDVRCRRRGSWRCSSELAKEKASAYGALAPKKRSSLLAAPFATANECRPPWRLAPIPLISSNRGRPWRRTVGLPYAMKSPMDRRPPGDPAAAIATDSCPALRGLQDVTRAGKCGEVVRRTKSCSRAAAFPGSHERSGCFLYQNGKRNSVHDPADFSKRWGRLDS